MSLMEIARSLTVRSVRIPGGRSIGQDTASVSASAAVNERVALILEAACRVVAREGAHGLRMASVAEEAGVSKALVHYYFSTRQELLRNAFAFSEERLAAAVADGLAGLATGAERLEQALLASLGPEPPFREQRALWNEVWSSLRFDDALRPLVERSYREWLGRIVALVEEGLDDGSIPASVDPVESGWRLGAVADGVDSLLYLGLVDRDTAHVLVRGSIRRELADA
jgi:AcrR family transcriptional regulator